MPPANTAAGPQERYVCMTDRIYRRRQVEVLVGLSRSTIYAMMAENAFPKPVLLGRRAVGWRASDVTAWLETRQTGTRV
ncbi:helix-turn-helix transcriptional regulator [Thalassobacter stenotrophicus]|uniref:helix-turn-helix transcriptional regulator n=1 Tax=Thalassobacter stenotrophicus TaxID=266809 RepID=UPI002F26CA95